MSPIEFYQRHLDRVSRSFAFCIQRLETPLRAWVSLTYLVCRILDTVEDAPWRRTTQQLSHFDRFDQWLRAPGPLAQIEEWAHGFPREIPDGERSLLEDSGRIFHDLHAVPARVRSVIQDMVGSMSAGMRHFTHKRIDGQLRLSGVGEVNQYCFFVAGVVGETLTKLLALVEPGAASRVSMKVLVDSHHFGLFLQKVNLLKDQKTDETDGRFLIPSRDHVWASLGPNAWGAMEYLEALPLEQRGYRTFCAWSLFLGLASLPFIRHAYEQESGLKISRDQTQALLTEIEALIDRPSELRALFEVLASQAGLQGAQGAAKAALAPVPEWLRRIYKGQLSEAELAHLGLSA